MVLRVIQLDLGRMTASVGERAGEVGVADIEVGVGADAVLTQARRDTADDGGVVVALDDAVADGAGVATAVTGVEVNGVGHG